MFSDFLSLSSGESVFDFQSSSGGFLWPGFGENVRVLDWILRRCEGTAKADKSAVGLVPAEGEINLEGLDEPVDMEQLFSVPKQFWLEEVRTFIYPLRPWNTRSHFLSKMYP